MVVPTKSAPASAQAMASSSVAMSAITSCWGYFCLMARMNSAEFIRQIKAKYPGQLVMADIATDEEAMACAEAGADFVGTTMRGYTPETKGIDETDFAFIARLAKNCPAKVIAEGHIHYPEQARKALEAGAFALVVGGAITRPAEITARFTAAIKDLK